MSKNQLLEDKDMGFNTTIEFKSIENTPLSNRQILLNKVASFVCVDRNTSYGEPEDSFTCIAELCNAYLRPKYPDINLTNLDVAVLLQLLKVGRLANNPTHLDSWLDAAGYAICGADIATKNKERIV